MSIGISDNEIDFMRQVMGGLPTAYPWDSPDAEKVATSGKTIGRPSEFANVHGDVPVPRPNPDIPKEDPSSNIPLYFGIVAILSIVAGAYWKSR